MLSLSGCACYVMLMSFPKPEESARSQCRRITGARAQKKLLKQAFPCSLAQQTWGTAEPELGRCGRRREETQARGSPRAPSFTKSRSFAIFSPYDGCTHRLAGYTIRDYMGGDSRPSNQRRPGCRAGRGMAHPFVPFPRALSVVRCEVSRDRVQGAGCRTGLRYHQARLWRPLHTVHRQVSEQTAGPEGGHRRGPSHRHLQGLAGHSQGFAGRLQDSLRAPLTHRWQSKGPDRRRRALQLRTGSISDRKEERAAGRMGWGGVEGTEAYMEEACSPN